MRSVNGQANRSTRERGGRVAQGGVREPSGKMLVPLLIVLVGLSLGVAAIATLFGIQERDKREAKERELHLAVAENTALKADLEKALSDKVRTVAELESVRRELAKTAEDLTKSMKAQEQLARSVEDREQEIGRLAKELEQTRSESKQVAGQLAELQQDREATQQRVTELEQAKQELELKLTELSQHPTVELEKVLVTNTDGQVPADGTARPGGSSSVLSAGQVVVVNRDYDFIVMNLGKNHGLSIGQEFQIVRDQEVLGKVKVEKVYDELSAAAILPESNKARIREGDTVRPL